MRHLEAVHLVIDNKYKQSFILSKIKYSKNFIKIILNIFTLKYKFLSIKLTNIIYY